MISGTVLVKSTDGSYESQEGERGASLFSWVVGREAICLSASIRAECGGEAKQLESFNCGKRQEVKAAACAKTLAHWRNRERMVFG